MSAALSQAGTARSEPYKVQDSGLVAEGNGLTNRPAAQPQCSVTGRKPAPQRKGRMWNQGVYCEPCRGPARKAERRYPIATSSHTRMAPAEIQPARPEEKQVRRSVRSRSQPHHRRTGLPRTSTLNRQQLWSTEPVARTSSGAMAVCAGLVIDRPRGAARGLLDR